MIEVKTNQKISLATVYNTIHAFKKKGYLKEIAINSNQTYLSIHKVVKSSKVNRYIQSP